MSRLTPLMLAVVLAVALVSAGCDEKKEGGSASADTGPKSGADVHVALAAETSGTVKTAGDVTVTVTIDQILDPATSSNKFSQPAAGNRFVAYEVTIQNAGTKEANAGQAKLRTADGFEFDRKFVAGIGEGVDVYQRLTAGGKVRGFVVFEIPEAAQVQWVRFDPNPFAKGDLYFDAAPQQ